MKQKAEEKFVVICHPGERSREEAEAALERAYDILFDAVEAAILAGEITLEA